MEPWGGLSERLTKALHLSVPPVAITFSSEPTTDVAAFGGTYPEPAADGRTGAAPAGCVFWVHGTERTFTTAADDHANCSVGSLTHGFIDLEAAAGRSDVAALMAAGWVTPEVFPSIPVVADRPEVVMYGPLAECGADPDVVLIRTNSLGVMIVSDAVPDTTIEGKPQCHIVALAKERGAVAASVGCSLSRARTGMGPEELTCAIPGRRLAEVVNAIEGAATTDSVVARYAGDDAARFGSGA